MKELPVLFVLVVCVCPLETMSVRGSHRVSDYSFEPVLTDSYQAIINFGAVLYL